MMTHEKNNPKYSKGMIGTLCILFLAIVLEDYTTQHVTWFWLVSLAVLLISVLVGNTIAKSTQKAAE